VTIGDQHAVTRPVDTGTTTGVDFWADSINVTIGTNVVPQRDDIDRPPQLSVSFPILVVWVKAAAKQSTGIPGVGDNLPMRHCASLLPQREASAPNPFGWQEWGVPSPRDKLILLVTTFTCNLDSTRSNNQPH
jgi:hypothetical protein